MRLTWLSNSPWTPYGYGVQTALFTTRLVTAGHPVAVISTYGHQGSAINWNGVQVFGTSFHPYGMDIMHGHSKTFHADALITLLDTQVMEVEGLQGTPWVPWFPVDHVTIPPAIFEKLKHSTARIAMSRHAVGEMDKAGMDCHYIPCGVDTQVYKPLPMQAAREMMQFPADKFIVGMVAANKGAPSRKAFQAQIAAFAALQKKHGDCLLYLHTLDGARGGWDAEDLLGYCAAMGLTVAHAFGENAGKEYDVLFADQYGIALGYTPEMMANLYSAFDVHTLVTMGEGFGIPLIEAQACGCPVITGSWTSMPELCFSGWKVDADDTEKIFTPMGAFQYLPHPGAIAEKMEAAYQMRGNQSYRDRARDGALAYDADKITLKYWLPVLKAIEPVLTKAPLNGNLAHNLEMLRVAQ